MKQEHGRQQYPAESTRRIIKQLLTCKAANHDVDPNTEAAEAAANKR